MRHLFQLLKHFGCKWLALLVLSSGAQIVTFAQDVTQTTPQAYQLQFENEWARVIRVHYEPRAKIPAHAHTEWPCAYVYLNDSGPIIFRHKDWEHPELTRPATRAGSFRLSPTTAVKEVHEVENPTDLPSDFLRVEFKTRPLGRNALRGRFYRSEAPLRENLRQVQFENEQLRVTRLVCLPRQRLLITTPASEPALLIVLFAAQAEMQEGEASAKPMKLASGQAIWVAQGRQQHWENRGDVALEMLRFDLKTSPVRAKEKAK